MFAERSLPGKRSSISRPGNLVKVFRHKHFVSAVPVLSRRFAFGASVARFHSSHAHSMQVGWTSLEFARQIIEVQTYIYSSWCPSVVFQKNCSSLLTIATSLRQLKWRSIFLMCGDECTVFWNFSRFNERLCVEILELLWYCFSITSDRVLDVWVPVSRSSGF